MEEMSELALVDVFEQMPDSRRKQGTRHSLQWCLAWFSQAVAARNRGFLSMGDWLQGSPGRNCWV
ncbi:MAG: hypothetical protein BRC52_04735 [Cyanobacteria bacterium SW_5_48_44]|nr:MAG: hypothetical protein BRC52_04735 [Cyanobacteria bacterium SW_5_48_44]